MSSAIPKNAYAMIIGAMKCGTTSLFEHLSQHPEICTATTKEPEYFSENQKHGSISANYEDLFDFDISTHKYTLEASTGYTKYPTEPNVAENIFHYGIRPKFIYILRNPFDRIESHLRYVGDGRRINIAETSLVDMSNYFLQLEQYRRYFDTSDILLLDFDELTHRPATTLIKVYDFLSISPGHFPKDYRAKNETTSTLKIKSFANAIKFDKYSHMIPSRAKRYLRSVVGTALSLRSKQIEQQKLQAQEKKVIHDELAEGMRNLHRLYGFDSRHWGFSIDPP